MGPTSGKRRTYMAFSSSGWRDTQIYPGENDQFDLHGSSIEGALARDFLMGPATAVAPTQHTYSMDNDYVAPDIQWTNGRSFDSQDLFQPGLSSMNYIGFIGDLSINYTDSITPVTNPIQVVAHWPLLPSSPSHVPPTFPTANLSRPYLCDACSVSFRYGKDLNRHISTVHATKSDPAYCCRCGKAGRRKDNYLRHLHTCNKGPHDSDYTCICRCKGMNKEEHILHVNNCRFHLMPSVLASK